MRAARAEGEDSTCAALPRARDSRVSIGAGRLRFRDARPGQRSHLAVRKRRRSATSICRRSSRGRTHRRVRALRTRGRLRRRRDCDDARAARATPTSSTARRRGFPTPASPTSTSSSRERRRAGAKGLSAFVVDAQTPGLSVARTHRDDLAASARNAAISIARAFRRRTRIGEEGRRLQDRDGDARRVSEHGRRGGARLRAPRARRNRSRTRTRADSSARRSPTLQLTQAAIADMATDVDASALLVYRAAWTKDAGAARVTREAAMAEMVRDRGGGARLRSRRAALRRARRDPRRESSSACTATCAPCASTKARARSSSS